MRNFRIDDESGNQEALFEWASYNQRRFPVLEYMHHIPNGGRRDKTTAIALKRQGVKAGVPDIFLPASRGGWHGLYIELKAGKNRTTEHQDHFLMYLHEAGYLTAVCYGWQTAAHIIELYLTKPHTFWGQAETLVLHEGESIGITEPEEQQEPAPAVKQREKR